jgi:hypothetical protein
MAQSAINEPGGLGKVIGESSVAVRANDSLWLFDNAYAATQFRS